MTYPRSRIRVAALVMLAALPGISCAIDDPRLPVDLPVKMRDHLNALHEIQAALAAKQFDRAAEIAEQRLGMTSMAAHGASHMGPSMPKEMQEIGSAMHHAASRFVLVAKEPAVGDHVARSLEALSKVSERCVACHAGFRLK